MMAARVGQSDFDVVRDPEKNFPFIHVERERESAKVIVGGRAPSSPAAGS